MLERHFELVRGVSKDAALRLVNAAKGAGFRARMAHTDTAPTQHLGDNPLASIVMLLVTALLSLFSAAFAERMRDRRHGGDQLPLAYDHDLRPALAMGYTHLLAAPAARTPRVTAPPSAPSEPAPSTQPTHNPLHQRALDALDGLNDALRGEAARLPEPVLDDLRRTSSALRDRANALAERVATLDAELAGRVNADDQAAASCVEARIERLRTLERAGALQDASELPKLERAIETHQRAAEAAQDLEDAHTLAIAHLLELTATATAARRDLLANAGAISAPLVVERLQREARAAGAALREVDAPGASAQGPAASSRQRT